MSKKLDVSEYITKVREVPKAQRRGTDPIYDEILDNLKTSGVGSYKISIPNKQMKSYFITLRRRIKDNKLPMKVLQRSGAVYIVIEKK